MFTAVGWNLIEAPNEPPLVHKRAGAEEFSIIKRNEFDYGRTTMSVIVRDSRDQFHVYCKVLLSLALRLIRLHLFQVFVVFVVFQVFCGLSRLSGLCGA